MSIPHLWKRIQQWHESNTPLGTLVLNGGASVDQIRNFEARLKIDLPDDLFESLRIHDGGDGWLLWYGDFMPLASIEQQWRMYCDWQNKGDYAIDNSEDWVTDSINGPIKPIFWNRKRIYLTDNSGDHLTLDLDPPPNGTIGQLLDHSHEVGPEHVVSSSWTEFLETTADRLEDGSYYYCSKNGTVLEGGNAA